MFEGEEGGQWKAFGGRRLENFHPNMYICTYTSIYSIGLMSNRLIFLEFSRQTHPIMAKRIWLLNISIEKIQINFASPQNSSTPTQTKHFCGARKRSAGFTEKQKPTRQRRSPWPKHRRSDLVYRRWVVRYVSKFQVEPGPGLLDRII